MLYVNIAFEAKTKYCIFKSAASGANSNKIDTPNRYTKKIRWKICEWKMYTEVFILYI